MPMAAFAVGATASAVTPASNAAQIIFFINIVLFRGERSPTRIVPHRAAALTCFVVSDCRERQKNFKQSSVAHAAQSLCRCESIMAHAPWRAVVEAEHLCGGQQEHAPAPPPQRGIIAIDMPKDGRDLRAMIVEIVQPLQRG